MPRSRTLCFSYGAAVGAGKRTISVLELVIDHLDIGYDLIAKVAAEVLGRVEIYGVSE